MKSNKRTRGTTLTELAVSALFVAVALVGTVAAIGSGSTLARSTAETRTAHRVAASLIEEVRSADANDVVGLFDGKTVSLDGTGLSSSGTADVSVVRVDDGSTMWAVYQVTIQVNWERSGGRHTLELRSLVSDRARGSGIAIQTVEEANG